MANKNISENNSGDIPIIAKRRGRPNKDICLWKDEEYKNNYFKKYFQDAKTKLGKITCDCGVEYYKVYEYKHNKTKCHQHYVKLVSQFQEKNI